VIFDDDYYYLGGLLAEKLRQDGLDVTLVTPAADVSKWSHATLEQGSAERRLYEIDVDIIEKHALAAIAADGVRIQHVQSGRQRTIPCASVLLVTMRLPNDSLYHDLAADAGRCKMPIRLPPGSAIAWRRRRLPQRSCGPSLRARSGRATN
jgi:dimethylamine/trimethylamine dehydrogenase